MSRISATRSTTSTLNSFSRLRCWAGESSSSKIDDVEVEHLDQLPELLGLALADERGRVGRRPAAASPGHRVGAGGVGEQGQLGQRRLGLVEADVAAADQQGALADDAEVDLGRGEPPPLAAGVAVGPVVAAHSTPPASGTVSASRSRSTSTSKTWATGPPRRTAMLDLRRVQVDDQVAAGHGHGHPGRRQAPPVGDGGGGAGPRAAGGGLPHAPLPDPHPQARRGRHGHLHVGAVGEAGVVLQDRAVPVEGHGVGVVDEDDEVGVADPGGVAPVGDAVDGRLEVERSCRPGPGSSPA